MDLAQRSFVEYFSRLNLRPERTLPLPIAASLWRQDEFLGPQIQPRRPGSIESSVEGLGSARGSTVIRVIIGVARGARIPQPGSMFPDLGETWARERVHRAWEQGYKNVGRLHTCVSSSHQSAALHLRGRAQDLLKERPRWEIPPS